MSERGICIDIHDIAPEQQVLRGFESYAPQIANIDARLKKGTKPFRVHSKGQSPREGEAPLTKKQRENLMLMWGNLVLKSIEGEAVEITPINVLAAVQREYVTHPSPELRARLEWFQKRFSRNSLMAAKKSA